MMYNETMQWTHVCRDVAAHVRKQTPEVTHFGAAIPMQCWDERGKDAIQAKMMMRVYLRANRTPMLK